jgi:large subunit ribosomal protein L29
MAQKEIERLRELTGDELVSELQESKKELFNLKFQWHATKQLNNPARLGALRHRAAQIKTVLRERELKGEESHA